MVRITEELVRKKSEHNELIIGTLEELSLHQEDVDRIEHVHNWCRHLEILLLQSNLISKIENLHKLKKLKYLNLAINNIEVIENLERCESLEKLDLTLNFIGNLESVRSLRNNIHLKELYLTGNPCADYEGYRYYVIANLPQLQSLDCVDITRSDRIKARQHLVLVEPKIQKAQEEYARFRRAQQERLSQTVEADRDVDDEVYWHSKSEHAPETRCEMIRRSRKARGKDEEKNCQGSVKKEVPVYGRNGKPLNINQAKLGFTFEEGDGENDGKFILDISVYKYLDTDYIDVDLQPWYARVKIKGKVFQYALPEEIHTDNSKCQRSQTTGHLVITMPKLNYTPKPKQKTTANVEAKEKTNNYLEVTPAPDLDFSRIVENNRKLAEIDPEIPPLEFA